MNLYKVFVREESEQMYKSFFEKDRLEKALLFQERRFLLMYFKYVVCVTDDVAYITEIQHRIGEGFHGFYPKKSTVCVFRYDLKKKRGRIIENREIVKDILTRFREWEFLNNLKYSRCLSPTVVRDIILGKLTSVDSVIRAYFKTLGVKGYSGKELLRLTTPFLCLTKALAVFDVDRLIPALRDDKHAEVLMRQDDLIQQAYWLGVKLNPFWSEKRFYEEHQRLTQILMKRKFEKMNAFHYMMEVIDKLGWQSMPVDTALDAVCKIVSNEQELDKLFYGDCADVEYTLKRISCLEGKYIYRKLFPIRFELTPQEFGEYLKHLDALREDVEAYMKKGYFFDEVASEWNLLH